MIFAIRFAIKTVIVIVTVTCFFLKTANFTRTMRPCNFVRQYPHDSFVLQSYLAPRLGGIHYKTQEIYYSLLSLKMISFVLFPQASQRSMNFNISELFHKIIRLRLFPFTIGS